MLMCINKISLIAKKYSLWHHIDAAYAGSALLLNKYKKYVKNINLADSFVFNPHKWMLTNFDCSLYYAKNHEALVKSLEIYPEYLKSSEKKINNYKDWSIQLCRRFRALKLWVVIRSYGIKGIKKYLKKHIKYAKSLSIKINKNKNFELTAPQNLNMINFRFCPKNRSIQFYYSTVLIVLLLCILALVFSSGTLLVIKLSNCLQGGR